jgi:hypothetical protein
MNTRHPLFEIQVCDLALALKDSFSSARTVGAAPKERKNILDDNIRSTLNQALKASKLIFQRASSSKVLPTKMNHLRRVYGTPTW